MNNIERKLRRKLYTSNLYEFFKYFWDTYETVNLVDGPLVQFFCETFQYACREWVGYKEVELSMELPEPSDEIDIVDVRGDYKKYCINVPPRHGKSDVFNRVGPTWLWTQFPIKVASVSHTQGLAIDMNEDRHKIVNSTKYKELFPEIVLNTNSKAFISDKSRGKNPDGTDKISGGEMYSINRNAFTGYGADLIINDDLTNAEAARKDKEEMNNAWEYYKNTMPSRINDLKKGVIINIQQRLAPNDITGHILDDKKLREGYKFIVLKAIFDKDTYLVCPISGKVYFFKKGDVLWQERFGNYDELRYNVGETNFKTQYLQDPTASDRTVFKEDMIREMDACDVPPIDNAEIIYGSHDFPVKDKETSDYLGSILGYRVDGNLYILDCLEERQSFKDSVKYVENLNQTFPGIIQVIEDKANGSPIIQQLQDTVPGIQPFQPGTQSKVQRAESASLYMTSGNVIFVRSIYDKFTNSYELSENLINLKKRMLQFPLVQHDDIVDSLTMLVLFVFMDKRYSVYGRSFNHLNIVKQLEHPATNNYYTIFFNKEGDTWKVLDVGVIYSEFTKLIVREELQFKGSVEEGIEKIKEFAGPNRPKVYIDCSGTDALYGQFGDVDIEHYVPKDFDKSVANLNIAFSKRRILLDESCKLTRGDIDNFKFDKTKNENEVKYRTERDGFVSCIRSAILYYGGINN